MSWDGGVSAEKFPWATSETEDNFKLFVQLVYPPRISDYTVSIDREICKQWILQQAE